MKKLTLSLLAGLLTIGLAACGTDEATNELEKNDTDKAKAKTEEKATPASSDTKEPEADAKKDEIWTYYNDAKWSDNYEGFKSEILKVVVTDKAPKPDDESAKVSAVGVKFRVENTTQEPFTFYPDQAVLVTSTGEQIDMPDMWVSDDVGGEFDKGVIKEGNIIWYLERGEAEKIEWIKMKWSGHKGPEDNIDAGLKEYEVELKLK
jgi:hypothetical protein